MENKELLHFIEMEYQQAKLSGLSGEHAHEKAMMNAYAKIYDALQNVQRTAFGEGWRVRFGNWLIFLGERVAQSGSR